MIKKDVIIVIVVMIAISTNALSQSISVTSFKLLDSDLTANTAGTIEQDQNGETAALIKVVTTQTGFTFDGGALGIVKTKQTPGEIWVYIPHGARKITIKHSQFGVLRDYFYPISIEAARTYEMVLTIGSPQANRISTKFLSTPVLYTRLDSVSYCIGMAQSQGLLEYMEKELRIDLNYLDDFTLGLTGAPEAGTDEKQKVAYSTGYQISQQIKYQMISGINKELFGDDSTHSISLELFLSGFISGYKGEGGLMTVEQAATIAKDLMVRIKRDELLKIYGKNKTLGEQFLAKNKKKADVHTLPSGVQYKVIKPGDGRIPKENSLVKVNYEGRFVDNKVFDSTYERKQPAEFRVNQVIVGWSDALKHMPQGAVWEIYIPEELAYGERENESIKPFSTLIFKIELLEVSD